MIVEVIGALMLVAVICLVFAALQQGIGNLHDDYIERARIRRLPWWETAPIVEWWKELPQSADEVSAEEFSRIWLKKYGHPYEDCHIDRSDFMGNDVIRIVTPTSVNVNGGIVGSTYVHEPAVDSKEDLYYEGSGCTWDIDNNGNRYYKLDSNGYPWNWDELQEEYKLALVLRKAFEQEIELP